MRLEIVGKRDMLLWMFFDDFWINGVMGEIDGGGWEELWIMQ